MYFDTRAAKLLKPGEHLTVQGCPGLRLVASATRKSWIYRYKDAQGRMKQVALGGQYPAMDVSTADGLRKRQQALLAAGQDPVTERKAARLEARAAAKAPGRYLVRQLVADYVGGPLTADRKAAGVLAAQRALERVLDEEPDFAAMPADEVRRSHCFDILDNRKATPTAAAKLRSLFGAAWELAIDRGRVSDDTPNWWRQVMRGKLKSKGKRVGGEHQGQQRRVLPAGEIAALLAWLPNMHELGRDAAQLYLWTVARGVEILAMRPEHITREADGWWWTVPKAQTKNARFAHAVDHRVPLIGRALKVVQRRLKAVGASGWLFEDVRGEQYTQHDFSTYIYGLQPYSAKAGRRQGEGLVLPVTHWTPHDLRRTSRTLLSALGCPEEIAEAIIGHMPKEIVGTYNAYTYDKERRLWLGKLARRLDELAPQASGLPARP